MAQEEMLFEGLKVLDVGSWIAGPVSTTMLADRGAQVLKIEVLLPGTATVIMPSYRLRRMRTRIIPGPWTRETNARWR